MVRTRRFWTLFKLAFGIIALAEPDLIVAVFRLPSQFGIPLRLAAGYLVFNEVFALFIVYYRTRRFRRFLEGYNFFLRPSPLSDARLLPKIRVQNWFTQVQVLIGIAGVMVAFVGRQDTTSLTQPSLSFLLASILLGMLYMFILGGGIGEDKTDDDRAIVTLSTPHEFVMEIVLNLQVIFLVLGSAVFFGAGPTQGPLTSLQRPEGGGVEMTQRLLASVLGVIAIVIALHFLIRLVVPERTAAAAALNLTAGRMLDGIVTVDRDIPQDFAQLDAILKSSPEGFQPAEITFVENMVFLTAVDFALMRTMDVNGNFRSPLVVRPVDFRLAVAKFDTIDGRDCGTPARIIRGKQIQAADIFLFIGDATKYAQVDKAFELSTKLSPAQFGRGQVSESL